MIDCFEQTQYNPIMDEPVVAELVNQNGIVDVNGVKVQPGDSTKINNMVGKPELDEAPSYYRPLRVIRKS
jgi:UTP--glucose-1-phosphate uridylyltransferase